MAAPSDSDLKFLYTIIVNQKDGAKINVDWDKVKDALNFKNANVARTRYSQVLKKLKGMTEATEAGAPESTPSKSVKTPGSVTQTPKTPRTPSKTKTATTPKAKAGSKRKIDAVDDAEESPIDIKAPKLEEEKPEIKDEPVDDSARDDDLYD